MIPLRDDNPIQGPSWISWTLIGLCLLVYLWQLSLGAKAIYLIDAYGMVPAVLFGLQPPSEALVLMPVAATVISALFLHSGWVHLVGNMLYLLIFGRSVEGALGHGRFLLLYLACGALAAVAQALPVPESTVPMIGASGAISGVLGGYLLLFPRARVLVALPIGVVFHTLELTALWVLGLWFLLQLLGGILSGAGQPGVAFVAHVGGFLIGVLLTRVLRPSVRRCGPGRRGGGW